MANPRISVRDVMINLRANRTQRALQAAEIAGIRAVLVHAISEDAKKNDERCGFSPSPVNPMTLMITIADAREAIRGN